MMNRAFIVTVICALLAMTACESKPKVNRTALLTPEEVVKVFCDLDASGKRLSSLTWSEMLPYISWPEEAMESVAVVISGYKILKAKKTNESADILVEYNVVGKYWPEKLTPIKTVEKVTFIVIKTEAGWKIKSPDTMVPHVHSQSLITHLKRIIKKESDPKTVKEVQDRIHALESL